MRLTGMVGYAEVCDRRRDPKYAGSMFDRLAPWPDQSSNIDLGTEGPISHYLGGRCATVLGRYEEAEAYFAQAAVLNDRVGAKFWAAAD